MSNEIIENLCPLTALAGIIFPCLVVSACGSRRESVNPCSWKNCAYFSLI